jgi:hypothetical protein
LLVDVETWLAKVISAVIGLAQAPLRVIDGQSMRNLGAAIVIPQVGFVQISLVPRCCRSIASLDSKWKALKRRNLGQFEQRRVMGHHADAETSARFHRKPFKHKPLLTDSDSYQYEGS